MQDILRRNNVIISGEGSRAIMFAHGFGCDQQSWMPMLKYFNEDYRIILFDFVGCGGSEISAYDKERYSTLDGYASDVVEIAEALELEDAIYVGHSISSIIGLLASIRKPNVFSEIVMLGPNPCYINQDGYQGGFDRDALEELLEVMDEDYIGWSRSIAPAVMNTKNGEALTQEMTDGFCAMESEIGKGFARATFLSDNRSILPKITAKTLTIQCKEDIISPPAVGQYINEQVQGNVFETIDVYGHCPHMSNPDLTGQTIRNFLDQNQANLSK